MKPIITKMEYTDNMFDIMQARIEQLELANANLEAIVKKLVEDIYEPKSEAT